MGERVMGWDGTEEVVDQRKMAAYIVDAFSIVITDGLGVHVYYWAGLAAGRRVDSVYIGWQRDDQLRIAAA